MDVRERIADLELRLGVTEMLVAEALARGFASEEELREWGSSALEQAVAIVEKRGDERLTARYQSAWQKALALAVRQFRARQPHLE